MSFEVHSGGVSPNVIFKPSEITKRQSAAWNGLRADAVSVTRYDPFEYEFRGPDHLLIAAERAERYDGETKVEGLPPSTTRNFTRKMTFVPAGHMFHGWQKPRALTRVTYFYIDPQAPLLDAAAGFARVELKPRIFFFDAPLWDTAMKLRAQVDQADAQHFYSEALGSVLLHELMRTNAGVVPRAPVVRGGLAAWQQKRVADYIEDHLADNIPLATLAGLVQLSPFHFARAFRQSFGAPPHRFHSSRRIERAKNLLADDTLTMTEIGQRLGFSESSTFAASFRKLTGRTPSDYRRGLE